ncbi:MAG: DUF2306 domain-containing protein [Planctomycetes bacterium]|nr:DUF2306 domain-containing protein [Planctomycetota bacterium]
MKSRLWILLALPCLAVGMYPLIYLFAAGKVGLLQTKNATLLNDGWWRLGFYSHIVCGGMALLVGWPQFVKSWRTKFMRWHRLAGKLYVLMVSVSGTAAVCIAPCSSTGWVAGLGFGSLGVVWLIFTWRAYHSIRQRDLYRHECQMIYSYSACLSAVTLRFWLPFLLVVCRLDFRIAYPIVAWLSWVPNLIVARFIVSRRPV